MKLNSVILLVVLLRTVKILGRDLSEDERNLRAAFVQKLLNRHKNVEGKIKLIGGPTRFEGNVYIYHAGRWGAVCDDSWDDSAAEVVCSNFNRTGAATRGGQFGEATEHYWMDDVVCEGDETNLSQCKFSGWGISDCEPSEISGVICKKKTFKNYGKNKKNVMRPFLHDMLDVANTSIRLIGANNVNEGRVEIYHKGVWGSICPDGWTLYEAMAVCHHLALGFAQQALQTDYFGFSDISFSGIKCEGNETNLFQCRHRPGQKECLGDIGHVAAVVCSHTLADLLLDTEAIETTAHLQDVPMYLLQCAMEENCLTKSAYEIQKSYPAWQYETRRLLRFTTTSLNVGNADFRPYLPKHLWQWHLYHMHYHSMEVFATFDVLNATGSRVAEGHKASFCLEDNTCLPSVEKKYSCKNYGDQGISANCSDIYRYNVDCQWVDVTDVSPGDYRLKVSVNPHARIAEQTFQNNAATCQLSLTDTYAAVFNCVLHSP